MASANGPSEPCHVKPFVASGLLVHSTAGTRGEEAACGEAPVESSDCCDYCGSPRVEWRKCKLVCADCRQINKSCADL